MYNSLWPMDCSLPGCSVHGILQAEILEWVAIPISWGSFWPRDRTWVSCTAGRFLTFSATREAQGSVIHALFSASSLWYGPVFNSHREERTDKSGLLPSLSPYLQWESTIFQCSHTDQYVGFQVAESVPGILTRSNCQWDQVSFTPSSPCWGAGQHRWITANKEQLNFSTCFLLFITGGTQLRTNKTCCVC